VPPYNVDAFGSVNPLEELHDVDVVEQCKETWRWVTQQQQQQQYNQQRKRRRSNHRSLSKSAG